MKKTALLVAVMTLLVSSGTVLADESSEARWNLVKKGTGFVAGLVSGFLFHEAGHAIIARIENVDLSWNGGQLYATTSSKNKLRNVAFAGFGAQMLSAEVILGINQIPKDNAYVLGWLSYDIFNLFSYSLENELRGDCGDLKTLRKTGVDTGYVEIGMVAYGLLTAYRIYKNPQFIPYVKATKEEIVMGFGWRF
jgi:hypothetical protein